jgi:threonine/homoserine/homoserine lactone efflux protein
VPSPRSFQAAITRGLFSAHSSPSVFLKGLILGFSIAAPVGPIGLLCIQRTLQRGRLHGFVSGLGVATADTCYGLVAAFGLGAVTSFLLGIHFWLQLVGGLFLIGLGFKIARTDPGTRSAAGDTEPGLFHAWASIFMLTLANPATILGFVAAFVALGLGVQPHDLSAGLLLVVGVFLGSAVWWLTLSFISGLVRAHLTDGRMRIVNRIAGATIMALGGWALWPLFM